MYFEFCNIDIFSSDNPKDWKAIGGRHLKDKNEANNQPRDVIKIVKFPNNGENILDKDVAIIKFDKPMTINDYVTPICLPTREPTVNDECVVVGWGDVQGTVHFMLCKCYIKSVSYLKYIIIVH